MPLPELYGTLLRSVNLWHHAFNFNDSDLSGLTLYLFSDFYQTKIAFIDLMLFSTLISAVDPVAVLSVFTEINVNEVRPFFDSENPQKFLASVYLRFR